MATERSWCRSQGGRADLLYARAAGLLPEAAAMLGFLLDERRSPEQIKDDGEVGGGSTGSVDGYIKYPEEIASEAHTIFFRVIERVDIEKAPSEPSRPTATAIQAPANSWSGSRPAAGGPQPHLLGPFAMMLPRLRQSATLRKPLGEIDVDKAVESVARAEASRRLPRVKRRRWGDELQIVHDRALRLAPFFDDYASLYKDISRLYPRGSIREDFWLGSMSHELPQSGIVIAFTDLGSLQIGGASQILAWARYGQAVRDAGGRTVAILPGAPIHDLRLLSSSWEIVIWGNRRTPADAIERDAALQRLLTLAAPAVRIEPGLLRELRLLLGAAQDANLESLFWQSDAIASQHPIAASFDPGRRRALLNNFATLDVELRREAIKRIWRWRNGGLKFVFAEEAKSLDPDSRQLLPEDVDKEVTQCFSQFGASLAAGAVAPETLSWVRRFGSRLPQDRLISHNDEERRALARLWRAAFSDSKTPPPGYDPAFLEPSSNNRASYALSQKGGSLFVADGRDDGRGSLFGAMDARRGEFSIERTPFWRNGAPPPFAESWGVDEYGAWCAFSVETSVGKVTQRLRWIAPGTFLMGSPPNEHDRFDGEGPQHEVTIGAGFWLFDTACTQALWRAVMGTDPSRIEGANRPVEQVSWNDAQEFITKFNARVPLLNLSLPSEAQWEYACRAGTNTPFSFGEDVTPDQVNFNGNYPYRQGKKGLNRQETVTVGSLPANAWGLYEMHGNVWEWCADAWHSSYEGAPSDGSVWENKDKAAERVLRGGSWNYFAQDVRSAFRGRRVPDARLGYFGFRCARVQDGAEPVETRRIRQAERRIAASPSGGAGRARIFADGAGAEIFSGGGPFVIRSDCERLTLEPFTRPKWASAIGRDRYGLWTEFSIGDATQKMRWINPGRFLMGSPEGEQDRWEGEGPQHEVTLARGFWLADTACTQALWQAVMGDNPSRFRGDDNRPVEMVSWNDAQNFFTRINERIPGLALGLPSEAQWEYACRAGSLTPFSFGENITPEQVNYDGNHPYAGGAKGIYREKTAPVASLPPNDWGLYEMHGNVWEWCADAWRSDYKGAPNDGRVWDSEDKAALRVLRGGSWDGSAQGVRSAYRGGIDPDGRGEYFGFRCARVQA